MVLTINIKKDFPNSSYAVFLVDQEIELAPKTGVNIIVAIHGYGSHGKGGVIKQELHNFLRNMKNKNKIINFVKGEEWSDVNPVVKEMSYNFPELILNENLNNFNNGVTVIWVRN